jgi:nucleoside-diphosphate-sugar epimerase
MFHRAPAIDKITAATGWRPKMDLDGILESVIAFTRESQAPSPT